MPTPVVSKKCAKPGQLKPAATATSTSVGATAGAKTAVGAAMRAAASLLLFGMSALASAQTLQCAASSSAHVMPVVELYTSEGCSSCPPADKWASTFKEKSAAGEVIVQSFHVGYWDYIGWVDRFAAPAYTQRQQAIASRNNLRGIYTPQVVVGGKDWPQWSSLRAQNLKTSNAEVAKVHIATRRVGVDQFEADITPLPTWQGASWSAYWTVTEHGHNSKVLSGENSGELLKHDFVVRQLVQAGSYKTSDAASQKLNFRSIAATPGHARQVNLVVFDTPTGSTVQAVSLQCAA